jgi:large subunit ribosomal protein L30
MAQAKKEATAKKPAEEKEVKSAAKKKTDDVKVKSATKSTKAKSSSVIKLKMIGSGIGKEASQKATLKGLGMTKLNKVVELEDTAAVRGMIRKVQHLVEVIK